MIFCQNTTEILSIGDLKPIKSTQNYFNKHLRILIQRKLVGNTRQHDGIVHIQNDCDLMPVFIYIKHARSPNWTAPAQRHLLLCLEMARNIRQQKPQESKVTNSLQSKHNNTYSTITQENSSNYIQIGNKEEHTKCVPG